MGTPVDPPYSFGMDIYRLDPIDGPSIDCACTGTMSS